VSASPDGAPAGGAGEPPDELFAALSDATRRQILRAVAEQGPVTATALADGLPVSRQAVAKHLSLLRGAGLVTAERSGRETRFTAATGPLDDLVTWAESAGRRWEDRLARLRRRFD
jgi:DNA-binding transcriptional ArsR family regulator